MKRPLIAMVVALLAGTGAYHYLTRPDPSPGTAPQLHGTMALKSQIVRGEYLARAADCVACHTTVDGKPFAGGLAFKLPFGILYSSNITPDKKTGIGNWSDEEFVRALHEGVRHDGQPLYPAFPYTSYSLLSRDDVLAIKAYLFSLPAVEQMTRPPDLHFPFDQRWAMGFWNALFFKSQRFEPAAEKSAEWNRGAYLATALAHCAECHTPRNIGFALDHRNELAGAIVNGWRAPNITADQQYGVGKWSDQALFEYLRFGHAAGHGTAGGPMAEAVENSLQYLDQNDTLALITYLRSVPPRTGDKPVEVNSRPQSVVQSHAYSPSASTPPELQPGLRLFEASCASCHQWNGLGQQSSYAGLLGARAVNDPSGQNVIKTILHGASLRIGQQHISMPAFASLSNTEIAQLSNYVIYQFGGTTGQVTSDMVAKQRQE